MSPQCYKWLNEQIYGGRKTNLLCRISNKICKYSTLKGEEHNSWLPNMDGLYTGRFVQYTFGKLEGVTSFTVEKTRQILLQPSD
jgi:hypothetical protein